MRGEPQAGGQDEQRINQCQHAPEHRLFPQHAGQWAGKGVQHPQRLPFVVEGLESRQHQHVGSDTERHPGEEPGTGGHFSQGSGAAAENQLAAHNNERQQQALDQEVAVAGKQAQFAPLDGRGGQQVLQPACNCWRRSQCTRALARARRHDPVAQLMAQQLHAHPQRRHHFEQQQREQLRLLSQGGSVNRTQQQAWRRPQTPCGNTAGKAQHRGTGVQGAKRVGEVNERHAQDRHHRLDIAQLRRRERHAQARVGQRAQHGRQRQQEQGAGDADQWRAPAMPRVPRHHRAARCKQNPPGGIDQRALGNAPPQQCRAAGGQGDQPFEIPVGGGHRAATKRQQHADQEQQRELHGQRQLHRLREGRRMQLGGRRIQIHTAPLLQALA